MLRYKTQDCTNFSRAITSTAAIFRPDNEDQLAEIVAMNPRARLLARGNSLSYSDCCLNDNEIIIDTSRLNHMLSFDSTTGILVCQGGVVFSDLFLLNKSFIPPVIPGTLHATLAGGVANDVHGKNNPHAASLGHHIEWLDLQVGAQTRRCSNQENQDLFRATIGGLGLTGIIKRVALRLRKASRLVATTTEKYNSFAHLFHCMQQENQHYDYQVAWLDLLNTQRAVLSKALHVEPAHHETIPMSQHPTFTIPKVPLRLITPWAMKQFNRMVFRRNNNCTKIIPLWEFNNPLDTIHGWNHVYGPNGLLQFQAVFAANTAESTINTLLAIMHAYHATPTLAVLKYFTQKGLGLLSFTEPGFTLAIDFIHNQAARFAITEMNQLMSKRLGKIYLAKDILLTREQFTAMYPQHEAFCGVLKRYQSPMHSNLSERLGINR